MSDDGLEEGKSGMVFEESVGYDDGVVGERIPMWEDGGLPFSFWSRRCEFCVWIY